MAAFIRVGDLLTIVTFDLGSKQIDKNHPNYSKIVDGLRTSMDDDDLNRLIAPELYENIIVETIVYSPQLTSGDFYQFDDFDVNDDYLLYDGSKVDEVIQDYFETLKEDDLPLDGMVAFCRKLYGSVSHRVRSELLTFIMNNDLVVNQHGNLLAYKAVRSDYFDKFSGTILNSIGATIKMDRKLVNANREKHCSKGLHAGGLEYIY